MQSVWRLLFVSSSITSLLLLNSGAKAITIERYAHQGITMPHVSAIKMQTKAAQTSSKCTSWKQDALEKELKIRIVQEVINNSHSIAPLNLSKDRVSHMKYYEEMHGDIVALVHSVHGKEGTVSAPDNFNCNNLEDAVTELRKSTFHWWQQWQLVATVVYNCNKHICCGLFKFVASLGTQP